MDVVIGILVGTVVLAFVLIGLGGETDLDKFKKVLEAAGFVNDPTRLDTANYWIIKMEDGGILVMVNDTKEVRTHEYDKHGRYRSSR